MAGVLPRPRRVGFLSLLRSSFTFVGFLGFGPAFYEVLGLSLAVYVSVLLS